MINFINYIIKNIIIDNIKKIISLFPLSKYGLCPLSFVYSTIKSFLSIEKSQLIIIYFNNIILFLRKYIIIIVITKILTLFFTFCYSFLLNYLIIFQNNFYEYCLSLPLIGIYYYDTFLNGQIDISKRFNDFINNWVPSKDYFIKIFNRERNMNDLENNMGEITNSPDRSFLLFFINFFTKKDIIDSERQPLLPKTSSSSISSNWVDIERDEEAELKKNNLLRLSSNNTSENNLSNEPSVNNNITIINFSDSNNSSDNNSNSNYGENIIQVIKGPYSLNNEISNNLDDDNLFIYDLENNIIPDYKLKRRHWKGKNKSLLTIPENEDSLKEEELMNKDYNNYLLDKDKLDFINKYLDNQTKYSLDNFYLLENNSEDLEEMEQWELEQNNKFNPDEDNQNNLIIIQERIENDEDNNEEINSSLLSDDSKDIESLLNKLEKITISDSYIDLFF